MRIVFILPNVQMSGGVKSTLQLADHLQARGHRVSVIHPLVPDLKKYDCSSLKKWQSKAFTVAMNLKSGNRVPWYDLQTELVRVPSLAERHVPPADIIVATWWANAHDINGYGDSRGKKFYFIRHYETWGGPPDLVDKSYLLPLHRITSSTWLKELIETKFAVRVSGPFPNGIDSNVLYREREGYEAHTPRRIGMLFRRISWKGMTDGLTALAMVREAYPAVQLVLFGETPSRQAWSILGSGKGVEFHKLPYDDRLRHIYNSLDIFVFSSHEEGFGNPPLEAMACGAACVTTRVGAVPDYAIPGRTALVVEPRRPRELAQAVMDLLADEDRRRGLARAGHDHVQQCTWENTVEELEKTFASVLEKERG